jgi:ubiquinone/menaquinone biosynthesis C-methylase UbiE
MRYQLQDYMENVIGFKRYKGKKVLEVGSGSGLDSVEFARNGALVWAVDSSDLAIKETLRTIDEAQDQLPSRPAVRKAEADSLPFSPETFDLVYCFGVLHHLKNPKAAIKEFARVLKPDGECIAMVYHKDSLLYAYSIEHLGLPFERAGTPEGTIAYTIQEATALFENDFRNAYASAHYQVIDTPEQRKVKLNIEPSLGLGWHIVVRARK